ncbi:H-NS histone family protein [Loktanella sp. IMCC34160]|uniref:H-NS histone family protein n=1 Tax=Loktanella sp. IMCC34160 TaxID=2510646 RepID=UPI00101C38CB|nr:H-NS histone family protein [Loktanella sp. IMCC34160]RYG92758.1 H-NS histone family protein [Loktanella sp. IMCC34160]
MKFNLKSLSRKELEKLRADVDKALAKVAESEKKLALEAAEKAARDFGFSLDDLTGAGAPKKRGRKPKAAKAPKTAGVAKYANPSDSSQTWTGKGRQPQWFKDAIAGGADPSTMEL